MRAKPRPSIHSSAASEIGVQVFRQTMLLPLAVETLEDADGLRAWINSALCGNENRRPRQSEYRGWREIEPTSGAEAILQHVEPSVAFRVSSLCYGEGEGPSAALFRDGAKGPNEPREDATAYSRRWAYAEAAYFHPFVQRFLFGGGGNGEDGEKAPRPLRLFRRRDIGFLRVEMGYGSDVLEHGSKFAAFRVDLAVERCDLYAVEKPGLLCLLIEVAATAATKVALLRQMRPEDRKLDSLAERELGGSRYCLTDESRSTFTLLEAQALHDGLRRLYPPFFTDFGPGRRYDISLFPGSVTLLDANQCCLADLALDGGTARDSANDLIDYGELPVAPWWETILAPIALSRSAKERAREATPAETLPIRILRRLTAGGEAKAKAPWWRQVVDERMPTLVFVAVEDIEAIARSDLVRLCFADHGGEGFPCDEGFLADFEQKHCYDRFRDTGTRYMVSSYSFVAVAGASGGFPPKKFSFALDVLQEHVRRHYTYMFLITHVQRAALLMFSRWMSEAMHKGANLSDSRYRNDLVDIRSGLAEFTHRYWFSNVSNQEQAREMFDLMQRHAGTAVIYKEVMDESAIARGEIEQTTRERQEAGTIALAAFLAFASILAIPVGLAQGFNSLSSNDFRLTPCEFHWALVVTSVSASALIPLVTVLQVEGRLGLEHVRRTFAPWRRGRAMRRMRWFVLAALAIMALMAASFAWRAMSVCNASPVVALCSAAATIDCRLNWPLPPPASSKAAR